MKRRRVATLSITLFLALTLHGGQSLTNGVELQHGVRFGVTDDIDDFAGKGDLRLTDFPNDHVLHSDKSTYYVVDNPSLDVTPVFMNTEYPYEIRLFTTNQAPIPMSSFGKANTPRVPASRRRGSSSRWISLNPRSSTPRFNVFPKIPDDVRIHEYFQITNAGDYLLEVKVRTWHQTNALFYPHLSDAIRLKYVVVPKTLQLRQSVSSPRLR